MTRVEPLPPAALPADLQQLFSAATAQMGFAPNDALVMAHWPELLRAMGTLVFTVWCPGQVPMELKRLVGLVTSTAAGCQYCVAHNAHGLDLEGVSPARQEAVWAFENSPLFSPAERAALVVARGAGQSPNGVTDEQLQDLRAHFTDRQIAEIVAVIGMFGFLNRWNATLRVPLEDAPLTFANDKLTRHGWRAGGHEPG